MGQVKPILELGSQIAGAIMGGKALYDAVTSEDVPSMEEQRQQYEEDSAARAFEKGLDAHLTRLSYASTDYVARHKGRIAESYQEAKDMEGDLSKYPDIQSGSHVDSPR